MSTDTNTKALLVSKAEAMQMLACSRGTIDRLERDGRLEPVRLRERGYRRYRLADVLKLAGVTEEHEGVLIA